MPAETLETVGGGGVRWGDGGAALAKLVDEPVGLYAELQGGLRAEYCAPVAPPGAGRATMSPWPQPARNAATTSAATASAAPLVQAAKKAGVRRFIYASSSSVYGLKNDPNVT